MVDLIKSSRYIDIFYAKTSATKKYPAGYHVVLAMLLFKSHEISLFSAVLIFFQNIFSSGILNQLACND